MDSLLANYASSDEEEASLEEKQVNKNQEASKRVDDGGSSKLMYSLPQPKSSPSSLFSTLPWPKPRFSGPQPGAKKNVGYEPTEASDEKSEQVVNAGSSKPSSLFHPLPDPKSASSSLFSSLPPPKTHSNEPHPGPDTMPMASTKRVVQIRLPMVLSAGRNDDDDEEEEEEKEKERRRKKAETSGQTTSVKSFLSSIPAPRNMSTLGALPSASGTSRRSIIEASNSGAVSDESEVVVGGNVGGYNDSGSVSSSDNGGSGSLDYAAGVGSNTGGYSKWEAGNENYVGYNGYGGNGTIDYSNWSAENCYYPSSGSDSTDYSNYEQYENNWTSGSSKTVAHQVPFGSDLRLPTKRGRKDAPPQIVEVNQDELMKNRPREDQAKLTGIAFGPSYQPVLAKGEPSKLHKRKHQIGSLYFDMKQKEMELAERRARGFLTKAQTQGKYGW